MIRHETVHSPNGKHSDPHDHIIRWVPPTFYPEPSLPINYFDKDIPEFKSYKNEGRYYMDVLYIPYDEESYRFKTISDFKMCMQQGGEVVIEWRNVEYGIWSENGHIRITCASDSEINKIFNTADEALEYVIGGDRLRDVITKVTVIDRTI